MFAVVCVAVAAPYHVLVGQSIGRVFAPAESTVDVRSTPAQSTTKISLNVRNTTVENVIQEIARQAKMLVFYDNRGPALANQITLTIANTTLTEALSIVGTKSGLVLKVSPNGETIMVRASGDDSNAKKERAEQGRIQGHVLDSATGKPIAEATVTLEGTSRRTVTTAKGGFIFTDVSAGKHLVTVKVFGYKSMTRTVTVGSGTATISFSIATVPTQLSGVVTTATGLQRKVEVGNDITTIKVDSVINNMPVQNMSDLLATRVPGLEAVPTSGNPGSPTRIRIRGMSSINASNDPIVIVDGVRVASDQRAESGNLAAGRQNGVTSSRTGGYLTSSPLDLIDVNSVETVEVLKGPSAVALYGSDAANGVIVITTRRGVAGPARWSINAQVGTESIPGKWPVNYLMHGHTSFDRDVAMQCSLSDQAAGVCEADSLVVFQLLNDPATTVLGRGLVQAYRGNVTGGTQSITYALSGSILNELGTLKMPDADLNMLRQSGVAVPHWQRRPSSDTKQNGSAKVEIDAGFNTVVTLTSSLMNSVTDQSPLRDALYFAKGISRASSANKERYGGGSGLLLEIPQFRARITNTALKSTHILDARSAFGPWLTTQVTAGTDVTTRRDQVKLGNGECFIVAPECPDDGQYNTGHGLLNVTSLNLRASSPISLNRFVSVRASVGSNYTRNTTHILTQSAQGLPVGATSGKGAQTIIAEERGDDRITAGVYFETVFAIANRWYFPLAMRKDAGSALGAKVAPKFPKLAFSYVASDESWFSSIPLSQYFSTLRLRVAYGQAGVQPIVSQSRRSYKQLSSDLDGEPVSYLDLMTLGNTRLKPERSREYEGGFDADILDNRFGLSLTWYRKQTTDLLTNENLPTSVGAGTQQMNLGDVLNTGFELTANVSPVQRRNISVTSDLMFSQHQNRLLRFGNPSQVSTISTSKTRFAIGYPLLGYWVQPIVGYADVNKDGVISPTEYVKSDSSIYMGAPDPKFKVSWHNTVTLFRNIMVGTIVTYDDGLTQNRTEFARSVPAWWDPSTPLGVQAITMYSDVNKIQTTSVLRFDALSIGYNVPQTLTRSILPRRTARISFQVSNVGLWTNYRGKDPRVNEGMSDANSDPGIIPQPRVLQLSIGIS